MEAPRCNDCGAAREEFFEICKTAHEKRRSVAAKERRTRPLKMLSISSVAASLMLALGYEAGQLDHPRGTILTMLVALSALVPGLIVFLKR